MIATPMEDVIVSAAGPEENVGVIETIKGSLQPESISQKFGIDKKFLMDVGIYGAIGFILGFLIKKYSEYFIAFVLFVVGLIVLQQFDYIAVSINIEKIHSMIGLHEFPMAGHAYGSLLWEWAKTHTVSAASLIVGFLIGIKTG